MDDALFRTNAWQFKSNSRFYVSNKLPQIFGVVRGRMSITANGVEVALKPGDFCLVPACIERVTVTSETAVELVHVEF